MFSSNRRISVTFAITHMTRYGRKTFARRESERTEKTWKLFKTLNGKNLDREKAFFSSVDRERAKFSHSGKIYDKDFYLSRSRPAQQRVKLGISMGTIEFVKSQRHCKRVVKKRSNDDQIWCLWDILIHQFWRKEDCAVRIVEEQIKNNRPKRKNFCERDYFSFHLHYKFFFFPSSIQFAVVFFSSCMKR